MEALSTKRERLRRELQEAYGAWLRTSEDPDSPSPRPVDVSGCAEEAQAEWFAYLAAKERLVQTYAEQAALA